jgi:hypothetical protein
MREVEKSKSVLYKTRASGPSTTDHGGVNGRDSTTSGSIDYRGTTSHAPQNESDGVIEQQLDPEQLQLFAQENQDMLKQYEDQLDKVRYVLVCPHAQSASFANTLQCNGKVAPRNLGAAVDARKQPQCTSSAY